MYLHGDQIQNIQK